MSCLICRADAESYDPIGDYQERSCGSCGRYRVSGTLVAEMEAQRQSFDVEATRLWMARNRIANPVPVLTSFGVRSHHLLRP